MAEIVFVCPDRHILYDGRTPGEVGVGGGITARIRMAQALARLGNAVTLVVNCPMEEVYEGVRLVPLDTGRSIKADVCIVNSSGGAYSLNDPVMETISSRMRIYWMSGIDPPAGFDAAAFTYVYAKSNFLRQRAIDFWGVDPGQVFVAYNGFENRYFLDAESAGDPRDPHRLVYFSHPTKGLDTAVRVLRILREEDERFHLHVFGGSALWGQEEQGGTSEDGVEFRGLVGQRELARELVQASYSICLQEREEPFGMVLTESQRAGCVVLASPVGAFPELIDDGLDGYLVQGRGSSEFAVMRSAQLILELDRDPVRRESVRRKACEVLWTSDLMASVWLQHWKMVEGGQPRYEDNHLCPECGSVPYGYPDGYHCAACGTYVKDRAGA